MAQIKQSNGCSFLCGIRLRIFKYGKLYGGLFLYRLSLVNMSIKASYSWF